MVDPGGLAERSSRLTPKEWRVVAMVLEGVSVDHACEALGIAPGTFESHKQSVRRKLAVPRGQRLEVFLRAHIGVISVPVPADQPGAGATPGRSEDRDGDGAPANASDRRLRWLLRITLKELQDVAAAAALRAELLEQTVGRVGTDEPGEASREVTELQHIAAQLQATFDRLLDDIRSGRAAQR